MSEYVDISPDVLRRHAHAVEDVVQTLNGQHGNLAVCHVSESAFGLLCGWMGEKFDRATAELVDGIATQTQMLEGYALGLRDTATDFEDLEAAIARLFAVSEQR